MMDNGKNEGDCMTAFDWLRPRRPADKQTAAELITEGNALEDSRDLDAAQERYLSAIGIDPLFAPAHLNLGNAFHLKGDLQGALNAFSRALTLDPGYAGAHYNMGNVYSELQQALTAIDCYRRALNIKPDLIDAEIAMGNAFSVLGRLPESVACYRRALALRSNHVGALLYLAGTLSEQGDWSGSIVYSQQALAAEPGSGSAAAFTYGSASHLCEWSEREALENTLRDLVQNGDGDVPPFSLLTMEPRGVDTAQLQLQAGRQFAEQRMAAIKVPALAVQTARIASKRLRIGYLSSDIYAHATMHLFRGVLADHDHEQFAIHCYSYGPISDEVTAQARQNCDVFRDIANVSDREAAAIIASDEVDILIDLKGYTTRARPEIQALRPAPVIVSWLGYPGTLGHSGLADYVIGDPVVTPPEHADYYSETLALMPDCYQPNDRHRMIGPMPTRQQVGLPATGIVFCSFNQNYKLNPRTMDLWCDILRRVPDSVLWILASADAQKSNLRMEAGKRGIDSDRLVFCAQLDQTTHLGRLQLADMALDTFPCTSHTTASDALWVGVPIATRAGTTFASRVAASLLLAAGVPELITHSEQEYADLVTTLALDPARLRALREKLVALRRTSPLFDTARFTRNLERLYRRIWAQHCAGQRAMITLGASSELPEEKP
jgi:predicted O-linked N-acetylglucosamine transferase (SPINDLY family)